MKNQKSKKNNKIIDIILTTVGFVLLVVAIAFVVTKFVNKDNFIFGKRFDIVLTGSMSEVYKDDQEKYKEKGWTNQIKVHDLITTTQLNDNTVLKPGDIVTYRNPVFGLTTHRIVSIRAVGVEAKLVYTIKGDANKDIDGEFTRNYIIGKVTNNAGQIGQFIYFLQSIWGVVMMVGIAMVCFVYSYLRDRVDKKQEINAINKNDAIDNKVDTNNIGNKKKEK